MVKTKSPTTVKGAEWEEEFMEQWEERVTVMNAYVMLDSVHIGTWLLPFIRKELAKAKKEGEMLAYGKLRQLFAEMPLRGYTSEELAECFDKVAPLDPKGLIKKIPKLGLKEESGKGVK